MKWSQKAMTVEIWEPMLLNKFFIFLTNDKSEL